MSTFNISNFERKVKALIQDIPYAAKKRLSAAGNEILNNSNSKVPRDTQTLVGSGYYAVVGRRLEVGYANASTDLYNPKSRQFASEYAAIVHEDLNAKHPVGQAKFLESAILEYATKGNVIAAALLKELEKRR